MMISSSASSKRCSLSSRARLSPCAAFLNSSSWPFSDANSRSRWLSSCARCVFLSLLLRFSEQSLRLKFYRSRMPFFNCAFQPDRDQSLSSRYFTPPSRRIGIMMIYHKITIGDCKGREDGRIPAQIYGWMGQLRLMWMDDDILAVQYFYSMSQSQVRFSFKNLEPINYLKTFNRMVDHHFRGSEPPPPRQLRVVSLSKFPTPSSYEQMEGIFQNVSKKKVEQDLNRYSKELQEEERFMKKHNEFMRKVLEKFIQHNQDRQQAYQKMKALYGKNLKGKHIRTQSETKLSKYQDQREKEKDRERTGEPSKTDNKATIGSEVSREEQQEEQTVQVLPKLQPRQKKQKVMLKREKEIENYLINRKLNPNASPSPNPQSALHSSRAHIPSEPQEAVDFKQQIVTLQRKQAKIQADFSSRVEKEIAQFGRKMNTQVHAINYFNFWKESGVEEAEAEREKRAKKTREQAQERQERVDFQVNFRNYQSN